MEEKKSKSGQDNRSFFGILSEIIENDFQRGPVKSWSQRDFIALSEAIEKKTGGHISVTTLKRILGKVEYAGLPYIHTLNILARFAGYAHWDEFLKSRDGGEAEIIQPASERSIPETPATFEKAIPEQTKLSSPPLRIKEKKIILPVFILVCLFFFLGWYAGLWFEEKNKKSFVPSNLESPGRLTYQIPQIDSFPKEAVFIYSGPVPDPSDLTVISCISGKMQYFSISPDGFGKTTYQYSEPGVYHAKIFSNNRQLAFCPVLVSSESWIFSVRGKGEDQVLKSYFPEKGLLGIPTKLCLKNNVDTSKRFHTTFRRFRDFGFSGDSFLFQTEVRNPPINSEITDGLLTIKIRCGNFPIIFQVARWMPRDGFFVQVSEKLFDNPGRKSFTGLQASLTDWKQIRLQTGGNKIRIWLDQRLVLEESYKLPLGDVLGLEYEFVGSGEIRKVGLKDKTGKTWEEPL